MSTCNHGSTAPDEVLNELHESQAGMRNGVEITRHKCCECAYARGYEFAKRHPIEPSGSARCKRTGRSAPETQFLDTPISQGRAGRHKCAICAFHEGYKQARAEGHTGTVN